MEKKLFSGLLIVIAGYCSGQQDTSIKKDPDADKIFTVVEDMPKFPGGEYELIKYLKTNLKYPSEARKKGIEGNVYVSFIIDTMGSPTNIKLLRGLEPSLDEEAISLIKNMPAWSPGAQNGNKVKIQYNQQVKFNLSEYSVSNYDIGIDLYKEEKYKKAISYFTKSINEKKNIVDSYYYRGVCQNKIDKNTEACNDWQKAKELGSDKLDAVLEKFCK